MKKVATAFLAISLLVTTPVFALENKNNVQESIVLDELPVIKNVDQRILSSAQKALKALAPDVNYTFSEARYVKTKTYDYWHVRFINDKKEAFVVVGNVTGKVYDVNEGLFRDADKNVNLSQESAIEKAVSAVNKVLDIDLKEYKASSNKSGSYYNITFSKKGKPDVFVSINNDCVEQVAQATHTTAPWK